LEIPIVGEGLMRESASEMKAILMLRIAGFRRRGK
jgi:hypothetical protein